MMSMRDWAFLASFGLFGLSGLVLILTALRHRDSVTTQAQVTSIEIDYDTDGNKQYYAIFKFKDATGREFTGRSRTRRHMSPYKEGQIITVLYLLLNNPERSTINSFREKYSWPLYIFALGLFAVVVGFLSR